MASNVKKEKHFIFRCTEWEYRIYCAPNVSIFNRYAQTTTYTKQLLLLLLVSNIERTTTNNFVCILLLQIKYPIEWIQWQREQESSKSQTTILFDSIYIFHCGCECVPVSVSVSILYILDSDSEWSWKLQIRV